LGAIMPRGGQLKYLPQHLVGIYPQETEGNHDLLDKEIEGDFIVRKGLSDQKFVECLEKILRSECNLHVKLTLREDERKVLVSSGKYRQTLVACRNLLEIYARELIPDSGAGGGTDDFPKMLQLVGSWIGRRIINEVQESSKHKVEWHYNSPNSFTHQEY